MARTNARKSSGDLAKIVVLESYAREDKWQDVLATVSAYGETDNPEFLYYKAAALYRTGELDAARAVLEGADFSRSGNAADAARLQAAVLRREGKLDAALAELGKAEANLDSRMLAAAILKAKGDDAGAAKLWREVLAAAVSTNAPSAGTAGAAVAEERAVAVAAANLGDAATLRRVFETGAAPETVRYAGLRLGVLLVRDRATFAEGAGLIRKVVKDTPDFRGAKGAFLALADAQLGAGAYAEAVAAYREAMETWPETAKDATVHEGLGWAFAELGRNDEALAEFSSVLELATDDETRATALVKSGDVLFALGRAEESTARYREALDRYPATASARKVKETVAVRELAKKGREEFAAYHFEEARRLFAEVARRDTSGADRMAYYDLVCLYGLNRDTEAEQKARGLAESSADRGVRADAALWLAKFLYNRGRWREAESNFTAAAEISAQPVVSSEALLWAARAASAAGDFHRSVQLATDLVSKYPESRAAAEAMLLQGESLVELARFDEAVLVIERASMAAGASPSFRYRAQVVRADALFAMGADNPARYREALEAYTALRAGEPPDESAKLRLSYKIARTLEKLKRNDEAVDEYYSKVVLAYRDGRALGVRFDEEAGAAFSRAVFRLAEEYESRGQDDQAVNVLSLLRSCGVPSSVEAAKRIERIRRKGKLL